MIKQWITGIAGLLCGGLLVLMLTNIGTVEAQSASCELTNNQEQMLVFFAPIYAYSQVKDILPQDAVYRMIGESDSFFQIEYNEGEIGWIDFHTRILNGICDAYVLRVNMSDTALSDFPTLCFYATTEDLTGYLDPDLTQVHGGFGLRPMGTYAVTSISESAIGLMGSSAMSGGYVEANRGMLWGHCSGSLQLAIALDNARVWTQPDALTGELITTFDAGTEVGVVGDSVVGNIQEGVTGDWVQIRFRDILGWVWLERLDLGRIFTTPQAIIARATVSDNTRLWSMPDAKTGQIITTVMTGSSVNIIGDSETGAIQLDSDLEGNWYPVQQGGNTGWIYEGRLNFED